MKTGYLFTRTDYYAGQIAKFKPPFGSGANAAYYSNYTYGARYLYLNWSFKFPTSGTVRYCSALRSVNTGSQPEDNNYYVDSCSTFTGGPQGYVAPPLGVWYAPNTSSIPQITVTSFTIYQHIFSVNNSSFGTITTSGTFDNDPPTTRTSTATPAAHYKFLGWFVAGTNDYASSIDGVTVAEAGGIAGAKVTVSSSITTADVAVEARFEILPKVTTQAANAYGVAYIGLSGTTTQSWNEPNTVLTLRAQVKDEYVTAYKFKRWSLFGSEVSTQPVFQIVTGASDRPYVAEFIPINYTLSVYAQNSDQGEVSVFLSGVEQTAEVGLSVPGLSGVEVRTVPTFGYRLTSWHDGANDVSFLTSYPFPMPESNLNLEARFAILPAALFVLTKKKGAGSQDPEDMGAVTVYHTVDQYVTDSPVGELALQASLFTTKQYRIVAAPSGPSFGFDGWYRTVEGVDVEITDDSVFSTDGDVMTVNVLDQTQIDVIARFSERSNCTFVTRASDSSVYEAGNPAEDDDCSVSVTTAPDVTEPSSVWLSGQDIVVQATQGFGWDLRLWQVTDSLGTVIASKSKGQSGFGQTFSFFLPSSATGAITVLAVSSYTLPPDQFDVKAVYKAGSTSAMGSLEITPAGDNYITDEDGSYAFADDGAACEITAIPANGYRFVAWHSVAGETLTKVSDYPTYSFTAIANARYAAEFAAAAIEHLVAFEGGAANRVARWRGKTYVSTMPVNFSCAKVYADGYPVSVDIGAAQSPANPHLGDFILRTYAGSQDPFRLPTRRREKYVMLGVESSAAVSAVAIATSMEELKNG